MIRLLAVAGMVALALPVPPQVIQKKVNQDARLAAEFKARVNAYMDLHAGLESKLPKLSKEATPEEIDRHQRALGRMIADARRTAKPGDLFTRDIRALFRRYLAA